MISKQFVKTTCNLSCSPVFEISIVKKSLQTLNTGVGAIFNNLTKYGNLFLGCHQADLSEAKTNLL